MHILALLDRVAEVVAGIHDLACEALLHGLLAALAAVVDQPAQGQGLTTGRANLDRDLIGGAADTAGLDFQGGHDVVHGLVESVKGLLAGLFFDDVKGVVDDLLSNTLLAVEHNTVDELGHQHAVIHGGNITSSGHVASLLH